MFLGTKKLWWALAILLSVGGLILLGGNIQPWVGGAMLLAGIIVFGAAPTEYGDKKVASREAKRARKQAQAAAKAAAKAAPAAPRPVAQQPAAAGVAARPAAVPAAPAPAAPAKKLDIEAADASQV